MSDKKTVAAEALRKIPYLHSDLHGAIMAALDQEGLFDSHTSDGPIRASSTGRTRIERVEAAIDADPAKKAAFRYAIGQLKQCGVGFSDILTNDGNDVSLERVNACLSNWSVQFRMAAKGALAACGLID